MSADEWAFTSTIECPDGTQIFVSMTVPESIAAEWRHNDAHSDAPRSAPDPVLECSELAQMGAVRAMAAYVATKRRNESTQVPF